MNRAHLMLMALLLSNNTFPCPTCINQTEEYTPAFFSQELYEPVKVKEEESENNKEATKTSQEKKHEASNENKAVQEKKPITVSSNSVRSTKK